MKGRKAYRYRLYHNATQQAKLEWMLARCRELYNAALQERREAYRMSGRGVTYHEQKRQLPAIKELRPEYREINAQCLQDVVQRLDRAFQAFFRRVKNGEAPGYPRFTGHYRYNSLTFTQTGWKLDKRLSIAGVGHIKLRLHRPIEGRIKTVTIKREVDHWYVVFSCVVDIAAKPTPDLPAIGLDMGLEYFATTSEGTHIANPRFYRQAQDTIARRNQSMRRKKRGGKNHAKAGVLLKKAHRKAANQRRDFHHKVANQLAAQYGAIAVEKLEIANMSRRPKAKQAEDGAFLPNGATQKSGLNKSINDAGWAQFLFILGYKAAEAGIPVITVHPAGTSQVCSGCGVVVKKALDERWHSCAECNLSLQRDHNAARNILIRAGLVRSVA